MTAAERRRADRERKRSERAERRAAGIPEQAMLDRAIVDALRDAIERKRWRTVCVAGRDYIESTVSLRAVIYLTRKALLTRDLERASIDQAIKERLASEKREAQAPASSAVPETPSPVEAMDTHHETWACLQQLCALVECGEPEPVEPHP